MVRIDIKKRHLKFFVLLVVVIGAGIVVAQFGSVPDPGHAVDELQLCSNDGEILKRVSGSWDCVPSEGGDFSCSLLSGCGELDPRIGVVNHGKYCTGIDTDGDGPNPGVINCEVDAPGGHDDGTNCVGVGVAAQGVDKDGNAQGCFATGGSGLAFTTIDPSSGSSPVADSSADTLNLVAGNGMIIPGDAFTDSIIIAADGIFSQRNCGNDGTCSDVFANDDIFAGDLLSVGRIDATGDVDVGGFLFVEKIEAEGNINTDGTMFVRGMISSTGTSVVLTGGGQLVKSSSSERYKKDIRSFEDDFYKILQTEPKTFIYKSDVIRDVGYIAEDFDELGLNNLLIYDEYGLPDSIQYSKITLYLVEVVKDQQKTIETQQEEIEQLKEALCGLNSLAEVCND